ncbi:MAG: two-component regulator propeller domain-containing protein [Bacteroidota bacterium]
MLSEYCRRYFLLSFISLLPVSLLHSQTPPSHHYTISDGLASSTVFDIIQDQDGFLWFATLNGLSRFDGKRFTTFRTNDGLNANMITSLLKGEDGALYIATYENGINVFQDGRIKNYCSEIDGEGFATSYLLEDRDRFYSSRREGQINVIRKHPSADLPHYAILVRPLVLNRLARVSGDTILALTITGLFTLKDDALTRLHVNGLPETAVYSLASRNDGGYLIGTKNAIWQIQNNTVVRTYGVNLFENDNDISAILSDRHGNIWFSIMNHGLFFIPNGSREIIDLGSKMDLQSTLVNHFIEDREGNVWISTFGKGVYCFNNLYLRSYDDHDGMSSNNVYSIVKERPGRLLIGTFNGLNILEHGRFDRIQTGSQQTVTEYIYGIKQVDDHIYVFGDFGQQEIIKLSHKGMTLHLYPHPSFCKTSNGLFLFGTWVNGLWTQRGMNGRINELPLYYIFGDSAQSNRVNEIMEDTGKNIWVGTTLGLCKISGPPGDRSVWRKSFFPDDLVLNSKILAIRQLNEHEVWFAGDKGIALYNLESDSMTSYKTLLGHDVSTATSLVSAGSNRIWIGTMRGLYRYDGNSMRYLNSQTGLPSDEVFSLSYDRSENVLYVGTSNGISFLDVDVFDRSLSRPLQVKLNSIKAGDSVYTRYSNLVFEPDQNNVTISFAAPSFSSPASVTYAYRLNDEWVETEYNFLNLISLQTGTYEIQIKARSQNTDWGQPASLTFEVKPLFIETLWFNLGILVIVGLVSLSLVTWRLKRREEKSREQLELTERINELKHQALSALMNPHFIFNSLNSVQYLINSQRNEEANDYIAMMARLIRKNLETAGSGFILLSEEMDRLRLYLDLEKLRFQERFSYEIVTGSDVDVGSVMIPNMIVQPFVENTLWHGIIDSGRTGLVTISFTFEDVEIDSITCRSLIIKITDNGIGLQEAKKHKKEDHTSKGIQIIEERLRLLSTKLQLPQPIMFEDLSSRDGHLHGTEVIISLPPPLYKTISPESAAGSSHSLSGE